MGGARRRTGFGIALKAEHDLRRSVPPRGNVLGHETGILIRVCGEAPCKTKIANFELAIRIDEQITRLQIPVEDVSGMYVFEATEDLIDEGLKVSIS